MKTSRQSQLSRPPELPTSVALRQIVKTRMERPHFQDREKPLPQWVPPPSLRRETRPVNSTVRPTESLIPSHPLSLPQGMRPRVQATISSPSPHPESRQLPTPHSSVPQTRTESRPPHRETPPRSAFRHQSTVLLPVLQPRTTLISSSFSDQAQQQAQQRAQQQAQQRAQQQAQQQAQPAAARAAQAAASRRSFR